MRSSDKRPGSRPVSPVQNDRNRASPGWGRLRKGLIAAVPAFFIFSLAGIFLSAWGRFNVEPAAVTGAETALARNAWTVSGDPEALPWPDAPGLQRLPLTGPEFSSPVHAASAILIDAANGSVLFEKNPDREIPPASMTKLVAMYVAFRAIAAGELSLEEKIEPPEPSWAENIPPHSSLMFLGKGQRLTVRELLRGMAVVSGNDGAVALAFRVTGGVTAFVDRMNAEVRALGLKKTRFVEPSGLSENNLTTAREFADFSRAYIRERPDALAEFHVLRSLTYPDARNLPEAGYGSANPNPVLAGRVPITQKATNPLLGTLSGCDGLKTGYIDESGYNLALTAEREGTRFISVTLGGPGNGTAEGNRYREEDGRALMEWAFSTWKTAALDTDASFAVVVWGGSNHRLFAVPGRTGPLTVPKAAQGPYTARLLLPKDIQAPIQAGDRLGTLEWRDASGNLAAAVPLIADRNSPRAPLPARLIDGAVKAAATVLALRGAY